MSCRKERDRKYREANRERMVEATRKWHADNPDKAKESKDRYRQSDKGRAADFRKNIKRRSSKQKVSFNPVDRKTVLEKDNFTCQCCGIIVHDRSTGDWNTPDKAHIDHIMPISKGGGSVAENLQILCRTCNLQKRDKVGDFHVNLAQ